MATDANEKLDDRQDACPTWKPLAQVALALAAGVALVIWLGQQHPLPYDRWPETRGNALVRLVWLAAALGAIAVAAGLGARTARERLLAATALLVLLAYDTLTHQPNQTPLISSRVFGPQRCFKLAGGMRAMITPEDETRLLYGLHVDLTQLSPTEELRLEELWLRDYAGKRRSGWSHLNLLQEQLKVNGSSNLRLREQDALQRHLYPGDGTNAVSAEGLRDFLGVEFYFRPSVFESVEERDKGHPQELVHAGTPVQFLPLPEAFRQLTTPAFDPKKLVILPPEAQGSVPTNAANARVTTHRFADHEILAVIETDAPTLVTIAQSFYHPWRAFVDGQPVKLWRANYAFQALAVPAGKHTVRLVYVDQKFRLGVGISLAGLAVCGWLWWRGGRGVARATEPVVT